MNKKAYIPISALLGALLLALFAAMTPFVADPDRAYAQTVTISYAENGNGTVTTLTAADPEGAMPIVWAIATGDPPGDLTAEDAADSDHFDISEDGVLTFDIGGDSDDPDLSVSPDFENPQGGTDNTNTYNVVVSAADAATGSPMTGYHKVTVMVTNVDEPGKVTWTTDGDGNGTVDSPALMQFQVGALLVASATDADISGTDKAVGTDESAIWRWYRGSTEIDGANTASYTVTADDVGSHIRVVVTYVVSGNVAQESASLTSDYPVLATRVGANALEFDPTAVSRTVAEGEKGMMVGAPVMVKSGTNHGAVSYALTGTDSAKFMIDQKTGQITTAVDLNYEAAAAAADNCATQNECSVTVGATDASGDSAATAATVTIAITNVNEKPVFLTDTTGTPAAASPMTIMRDESMTALADTGSEVNVTYRAMDPEDGNITYHLMGSDGNKFQLSNTGVLSFRAAPDYEMPGDANRDNMYELTVRASDGTLHEDRMVMVTVNDANEAPVLSGPSSVSYAENGTGAVATFTAADPEGAMSITWSLAQSGTDHDGDDGPLTIADAADDTHFDISEDGVLTFDIGGDTDPDNSVSPDFEAPRATGAISDANTNTYMVVVGASDGTNTGYHKVEIMVTDVAERGEVTWAVTPDGGSASDPILKQFEVGAALAASATDGDISGTDKAVGTDEAPTWRWYRGGTEIDGADTANYTVTGDDVGSHIRVVVTYVVSGNVAQESASLTSDYPVLRTRIGDNVLEFDPTAVSRTVAEGEKGMNGRRASDGEVGY